MGNSSKKIRFKYDADKAGQAILWLLHRHGGSMDKLKLIKLFFYADRLHLLRYGRPIVGGHYFAMNFGPVSSELKDIVDSTEQNEQLPFRIAELARQFRYEKSGELTGLMRVRTFCLADSHIICQQDQAIDEISGVLDLIEYVTSILGP